MGGDTPYIKSFNVVMRGSCRCEPFRTRKRIQSLISLLKSLSIKATDPNRPEKQIKSYKASVKWTTVELQALQSGRFTATNVSSLIVTSRAVDDFIQNCEKCVTQNEAGKSAWSEKLSLCKAKAKELEALPTARPGFGRCSNCPSDCSLPSTGLHTFSSTGGSTTGSTTSSSMERSTWGSGTSSSTTGTGSSSLSGSSSTASSTSSSPESSTSGSGISSSTGGSTTGSGTPDKIVFGSDCWKHSTYDQAKKTAREKPDFVEKSVPNDVTKGRDEACRLASLCSGDDGKFKDTDACVNYVKHEIERKREVKTQYSEDGSGFESIAVLRTTFNMTRADTKCINDHLIGKNIAGAFPEFARSYEFKGASAGCGTHASFEPCSPEQQKQEQQQQMDSLMHSSGVW